MIFSSRKGSTEDIVLHPLFVVGIAIGIVLLVLLQSIYKIGNSEEFEKWFVATDTALLIDSLYAVRPDIALQVQYTPGKYFGTVSENKVAVFSKDKEDTQYFFFTEDPTYQFQYSSWIPGKPLNLFKSGNTLGIGETLRLKPYCPKSTKTFELFVSEYGFASEGDWALKDGKPVIRGKTSSGKPLLKIYVNKNADSEILACRIAQSLFEQIPELNNYAIVPFSPEFIPNDDSKKVLADSSELGLFIELTSSNPSTVHPFTAITRGLRAQ